MWFLKSGHRHIKAETLNEYLDGRLGGNDLAKIEGRLQACDSCQDELEELRATIAVVRQMPMEQPRHSFVMDAPPLPPAPTRQSFYFRAPNWAYAGAASIAVIVLAALVSVDATGGLSPAADSPEVFVATAPQNRAAAPQAAATAASSAPLVPQPQATTAALATAAAAVADTAGSTALTDLASQATKRDGTEAAESTVRQAAKGGEDSAAFTVTTAAAPSDSTAEEETGPPSAAAANAAEPLPESAQTPAPTVELAPAAEVDETADGTSVWWRVLEGVAAAAALSFVAVLVWTRRSSRN